MADTRFDPYSFAEQCATVCFRLCLRSHFFAHAQTGVTGGMASRKRPLDLADVDRAVLMMGVRVVGWREDNIFMPLRQL